jgi:hypothetical protein
MCACSQKHHIPGMVLMARRSTAGRFPVKEVMGVRISPCQQVYHIVNSSSCRLVGVPAFKMKIAGFFRESHGHYQMVGASGRQPKSHRFKSGMSRRARIAQRQSTRTTTWRGTFGSCWGYSAPVVKRTSRLTTNQETGGSSPSGSAQARLAQWESTWSTPRGRRSDSFAEHGGRTEWRGAGA